REARQRPAKPSTRVRIPSPPRSTGRAIGAAVARFPDTEEVTGSIPVSPTSVTTGQRPFRGNRDGLFPCPGAPYPHARAAPRRIRARVIEKEEMWHDEAKADPPARRAPGVGRAL